MGNNYEVPNWSGKPKDGLYLEVTKDQKFLEKLKVDEKTCYFFGRSGDISDFVLDHASCSRLHAVLTYHKHLNLSYLTDLGSTHGTFIGRLRIDAYKATVIRVGTTFRFGASTREYTLCEKIESNNDALDVESLTEYNTVQNRKIDVPSVSEEVKRKEVKRKSVQFNSETDVINPEDIDPSVSHFKNLVETTIVPFKKLCVESSVNNVVIHKSLTLSEKNQNNLHSQLNLASEIETKKILSSPNLPSNENDTAKDWGKKVYQKECFHYG